MNPLLPPEYFIPDVEARTWGDGRIYLYGSVDIPANTEYGSHEYRVFSSDDMRSWVDHGISFESDDVHSDTSQRLFAPDCLYHNDAYHLFYCTADNREGVASSKSPAGPFRNSRPLSGADGDSIDPAIFKDDDGQIYYFWGQFELRGAKLTDDLGAIDAGTLKADLLTEAEHGFHEGASVRKRGDTYYLVYTDISRGRATSLGYATSSSPLGPYTKRGIIIDNTGCDAETWNNHGSIEAFEGQWYVFYHRSSQASRYSRRCCVERIFFNEDGTIDEVEMTTEGAGLPLGATDWIKAYRACLLGGSVRSLSLFPDESQPVYDEVLSVIEDGDYAAYKFVEFDSELTSFHVIAASASSGGIIEARLDSPTGRLIAECSVTTTGGWNQWQEFSVSLNQSVAGRHPLFLIFRGKWGRLFDLDSFWFSRG